MSGETLKPCPFCGGDAMECHVAEPSVQCQTCAVGMVGDTEAEAIAAWNTRPLASPLPSECDLVERLRAMAPRADDGGEGRANRLLYVEAADTITRLSAEIASLQAKLGVADWQPIETAPKDGTMILAWCVHPYASSMTQPADYVGPVVTRWIDHNDGGWTWHGHLGNFTHWQPLPDPPARFLGGGAG